MTAIIIMSAVILMIIIGLFKKDHEQTIQGQMETTDYRVSSKVPARVVKFYVTEGQFVHAGDTLVRLSAPDVDAKEDQAKSARDAAEAIADMKENGTRKEAIRGAYDVWQQSIAKRQITQKTYQRMQSLFLQGVISAQKRDEANAAANAAKASEQAARSQYDMAVNGSRDEEKRFAEANVRVGNAVVAQVKSYVEETVLTATADGYVSEIFPEVGELVGSGAPIMNIVTNDAWFTFNIREDLLPGIEIGQQVRVYMPATNETIPARITLMKNEGNFAAWKATRALEDVDLKVFEVQARPLRTIRTPHSGMSVTLIK